MSFYVGKSRAKGASLPKFELAAHAGCIAKDSLLKFQCLSMVVVYVFTTKSNQVLRSSVKWFPISKFSMFP